MSQIANITVFDGADTPVSHTLVPVSVTRANGVVEALWRENLPSVPMAGQVRASMRLEQLKSGVFRTEVKVVVPVMESIGGANAAGYTAAPKVAFENTQTYVGFYSDRSDKVSRKLSKQILVNILNNVSTSVVASTTGPAPELINDLISPT